MIVGFWWGFWLATQVFTDEELEGLRRFPEIGREELFRFFTLTSVDVAFVDPGRGRRIDWGLPWPCARCRGWGSCRMTWPRRRGRRAKTRTEHLRQVARYLGWRPAGALELKELDEFLLTRAMEHGSPTLLFRLAAST